MEGGDDVRRKLALLARQTPQAVGAAMFQEALLIEENSRSRTPVDTGALRASHETSQPEYKNGMISVVVRVGGPAAPYAIPVHENLTARHRVGEAKFLERAFREGSRGLAERIARRVDLAKAAR